MKIDEQPTNTPQLNIVPEIRATIPERDEENRYTIFSNNIIRAIMANNGTRGITTQDLGNKVIQVKTEEVFGVYFTKEGELFDMEITPETKRFLVFLMGKLAKTTRQYESDKNILDKNRFMVFPYAEYMRATGLKDKTNAKQQIIKSVGELWGTNAHYQKLRGFITEDGKKIQKLFAGVCTILDAVEVPVKEDEQDKEKKKYPNKCIVDGLVYIRLGATFTETAVASALLNMPENFLEIDIKKYKHAQNLVFYFVNDKNMNPDRGQVKLTTLLRYCPDIPKIDEITTSKETDEQGTEKKDSKGRGLRISKSIMYPLITNLEALKNEYNILASYNIVYADGTEFNYEKNTTKEDIEQAYIKYELNDTANPLPIEDLRDKVHKHKVLLAKERRRELRQRGRK